MSKVKWIMVFCVCSFLSFAQNNSVVKTDNRRVENLASLSKVWGFLKYYHPNVAKGDFNWDEQLLQMIPKVQGAQNKEELSKIYLEWIADLGAVKECKSCKEVSKKEYFDKNFDLSWLNDSNVFTAELSQKLKFIEENRFQGKSKYVTAGPAGNIEMTNEPEYVDSQYPDIKQRLLGLFRYWNTIEYFFPYKYITDQNWDAVLLEMIPRFEKASNATEYQLTLLESVVKLDDTHAWPYSDKYLEFFGRKYIPAFINVIEDKAVIVGFYNDSLAKINDIRKGDIVEQVEDKDVLQIMSDRAKYVSGSNRAIKAKGYEYLIFNGTTDSVKVKVRRGNLVLTKMIKRYVAADLKINKNYNKEKFSIDQDNVGYVNMAQLEMDEVPEMMQKLDATKALIIDLRNYPKFIPYTLAKRLFKNAKEFSKVIKPDLTYPGKFVWEKAIFVPPLKNQYYSKKVVVLVNEETQSRAEWSAMLLQSGDNVTTIGSQTAAADGNVSKVGFPGFTFYMSGIGVFYPNRAQTQRVGVKVDIEVHPTIKGIQEGKDEVLEAAKEFLNKPGI